MPLKIDLMDNAVIGPAIRRGQKEGWRKGWREGWREGWHEGRRDGMLTTLQRLMENRFNAPPDLAEERFSSQTAAQLQNLFERALFAKTLEEFLE